MTASTSASVVRWFTIQARWQNFPAIVAFDRYRRRNSALEISSGFMNQSLLAGKTVCFGAGIGVLPF
jgi:hypothetical protein